MKQAIKDFQTDKCDYIKFKRETFKEGSEKDAQKAVNNYNVELGWWRKLFTGECMLTVKDLEEALEKLSDKEKRSFIRGQFYM